jgi:pimeloyl-ACP methyl ester carboxylesterase
MRKLINFIFTKSIGLYFNIGSYIAPKTIAKKAFLLFCTPRKGKVTKGQNGFLEDAKDLLLDVNNNCIQTYRWKGSGKTVLLLHGWESNTFRWRNFIPRLQEEGFNIVAMDAPAHGYSSGTIFNVPLYTSAAQKVIDTYQPTYVIGHSIGGMTLLYNLFKYPEENKKIVKAVTLGSPSELADFMRQYKVILGLNKNVIQQLETYFIKHFGFTFNEFSSSKFAKAVAIQGLLIHDELDAIAPYWSSQQVHANWKNSRLVTTKGLGHSLHQDKVRDQILDFLKS